MDESERNRLRTRQTALLLATSDMQQAAAAARALRYESDRHLAGALETAIAVAYMRPFTGQPPHRLPEEYVPVDSRYHAALKRLRDKVYAHTDAASGRTVSFKMSTRDTASDTFSVQYIEEWTPLDREEIPGLVEHFERQRDRFGSEVASIHVQLHGLGSA